MAAVTAAEVPPYMIISAERTFCWADSLSAPGWLHPKLKDKKMKKEVEGL